MERNAAEYGMKNSIEPCRCPHIEASGIPEPHDPILVRVHVGSIQPE